MSIEDFYVWLDRIAKFNGYTKINDDIKKGPINLEGMKEYKL